MPEGLDQQADIYLIAAGEANVRQAAVQYAEKLRDELPFLRVLTHCGGGSIKSQMKKADKSGADVALILAEDEVASGTVVVKYLRLDEPQQTLTQAEAIEFLQSMD